MKCYYLFYFKKHEESSKIWEIEMIVINEETDDPKNNKNIHNIPWTY